MSEGTLEQTFGEEHYRLADGYPTHVRIVVENRGRLLTALELKEFALLQEAAEQFLHVTGSGGEGRG